MALRCCRSSSLVSGFHMPPRTRSISSGVTRYPSNRFHLILNLSATMQRVLGERSRQLVLPPRGRGYRSGLALSGLRMRYWGEAAASDAGTTAPAAPIGAIRGLCQHVQLWPVAGSDCPHPGYGKEDDPTLLRSGHFPERKPPHRRPPKFNHFAEYLQQRWDEGGHNAAQL